VREPERWLKLAKTKAGTAAGAELLERQPAAARDQAAQDADRVTTA
jgi:hypothetical protein